MKSVVVTLVVFLGALLALETVTQSSAQEAQDQSSYGHAPKLIEFNVPGTGAGSGQGTSAFAINPDGAIAGYYVDAVTSFHGFLRDKDGTITTFDPPGACTMSGQGTQPSRNSPSGEITGFYIDSNGVHHGFRRIP